MVLEENRLVRAARVFELEPADTFALTSWGSASRYLLVTAYTDRAHAALFDQEERTFVPGALPLGFGFPGAARPDGDTAWVLLPWEASLIQVGPASN